MRLLRRFGLFFRVRKDKTRCNDANLNARDRLLKGRTTNVRGRINTFRRLTSTCKGRIQITQTNARCFSITLTRDSCIGNNNRNVILSFLLKRRRPKIIYARWNNNFTSTKNARILRSNFTKVKRLCLYRFLNYVRMSQRLLLRHFRCQFIAFDFGHKSKNSTLKRSTMFLRYIRGLFLRFPRKAYRPNGTSTRICSAKRMTCRERFQRIKSLKECTRGRFRT